MIAGFDATEKKALSLTTPGTPQFENLPGNLEKDLASVQAFPEKLNHGPLT